MVDHNIVRERDVCRDDLSGTVFKGVGAGPHHGVLVLHGSSKLGHHERRYAQYLAHHGYTTFCLEYFGAPGTPQTLTHVPMTYFGKAINWLTAQPDVKKGDIGAVGFSRGGEAALLIGAEFDDIGVVVGYVPSAYVFPAPTWMTNEDNDVPAWMKDGNAVPYISLEGIGENVDEAYEDPYETEDPDINLQAVAEASSETVSRATIPVENIAGPVLLISGGSDNIWPSTELAEVAVHRLDNHHHPWRYQHLVFPDAGHAIRSPYWLEADRDPHEEHRFGGTLGANARASAEAWSKTIEFLSHGLQMRDDVPD